MLSPKFVTAAAAAICVLAQPAWAREVPADIPVLEPPGKVVSLHRPYEDWRVVTTIVLAIKPTTTPDVKRTFRWSDSARGGKIACEGAPPGDHQTEVDEGVSAVNCTYEPKVGWVGSDTFTYDAKFAGGEFSEQATVTIEVRDRGFRWEFKTKGSTITSDSSPDPQQLAEIPSILGGTSQDFLLTFNWQTVRPRNYSPVANKKLESLTDAASKAAPLSRDDIVATKGLASHTANAIFETGVQSETVAATVVDVGPSATNANTSAPPPAAETATEQTAARRNLVFRGELNYNAGLDADGIGRFVEIGALGRGSFSTVMDSDESFKEAVGRVLQVIPKDRTSYRADIGARLAVKQDHELKTTTIVKADGQIERPTNIENMLLVEFAWRYDKAMDVPPPADGGDPRKRWVLRAELSPEIGALPGHQLPAIGIEVSKPWHGGSPTVKVTYGINLSASKGIIKPSDNEARR